MHRLQPIALLGLILMPSCTNPPDEPLDTPIRPLENVLSVELVPYPPADPKHPVDFVIIRFHNNGREPIHILKPVDGSSYAARMPYYLFRVYDEDSRQLKHDAVCRSVTGLYSDTKWPDDYLVEIKPGESLDMGRSLYVEAPHAGPHKICFEYIYQPVKEVLAPPPQAWRGSIRSNEILVNLTKNVWTGRTGSLSDLEK